MKPIRIVVTGAGAPGIAGTIHSLRENPDGQKFYIIGTDVKSEVVGKYLCDDFQQIPGASNSELYLDSMIELVKEHQVDVILPQNTAELSLLSRNRGLFSNLGTKLIVSDETSIEIANSKFKLMQLFESLGLPVGKFYLVSSEQELMKSMNLLGWPDKKIVVKLPESNGQRGVRIVTTSQKSIDDFRNKKPGDLTLSLQELLDYFKDEFPPLIVTEYLSGPEFSVDVFRGNNDTRACIVPRKRLEMRSGITFSGVTEQHQAIIDTVNEVINSLNLRYCFGFQFKLDDDGIPKLLESNPRVQGTMVHAALAGANVIYASICDALDRDVPEMNVIWGHQLLRYWGAIGVCESGVIKV